MDHFFEPGVLENGQFAVNIIQGWEASFACQVLVFCREIIMNLSIAPV